MIPLPSLAIFNKFNINLVLNYLFDFNFIVLMQTYDFIS